MNQEKEDESCLGNDKYFLWKLLQQFCFSFNHGKVPLKEQSLPKKKKKKAATKTQNPSPRFFHIFNVWNFKFCYGSISGEEVLKNPLQLFVAFHLKTISWLDLLMLFNYRHKPYSQILYGLCALCICSKFYDLQI